MYQIFTQPNDGPFGKLVTEQFAYFGDREQRGVFLIDENGAAILPTAQYPAYAKSRAVRFATQSGPMLVINKQINPALPRLPVASSFEMQPV